MAHSVKSKSYILIWFGFVVTGLMTWIVKKSLWYLSCYYIILWVLAAIHVVLGLRLLNTAHFAWHTLVFVVTGIIIGQWWLAKFGFMLLTWSIGGFAP